MLTKELLFAGRAIFTIQNQEGIRYTFKLDHSPANGRFDECYFLSYLIGQDNEGDFAYIGKWDGEDVRLTTKSRLNRDSLPYKVGRWILRLMASDKNIPEGYFLEHAGRCCRCGRTLTTPESIETGIGPECAKRLAKML